MWLYDVSKPTKLRLVKEVKEGTTGDYRRLEKKTKTLTAADNLKLWLTDFFDTVCDVLPTCENTNGATSRHLPSWFTREMILNLYTEDMEKAKPGDLIIKPRKFVVRFLVPVMHNWDEETNCLKFLPKSMKLMFSSQLCITGTRKQIV